MNSNKIFFGSLLHPVKNYCLPSWFKHLDSFQEIFEEKYLISTSDSKEFLRDIKKLGYSVDFISSENLFEKLAKGRLMLFVRRIRCC